MKTIVQVGEEFNKALEEFLKRVYATRLPKLKNIDARSILYGIKTGEEMEFERKHKQKRNDGP